MKIRSAFVCAPALAALALVAACGGGSSGDSSGAAGTSAVGGSAVGLGGGNAGGSTSSAAGTASGGASSVAGTAGTAPGTSGASGASTGGASTGGAGTGGAAGGAGGSGGAAGGMAGSGGAPSAMIPDTKVVMYLPNWSGSFASWATKIDFNKMTHLNLAFGTVNTSNNWSMGAADADVKTLAAAAHAKNVKVLVSIGGADDDIGIINQYHTVSNIDPLVANLDAMVTRLNLDGVDVDLERGDELKSSGNFSMFLAKLEATLKPEGKLVTAALAQYIMQAAGNDATVSAWLNSYDFINLMIYNTNMGTYTNELTWWKTTRNIPSKKLTWGVQFAGNLSTAMAKQLTTASLADGGVMVWEYSQGTESTLWPAMQSVL